MVDLGNQVVDRRHLVLVNRIGGQLPLAQQATHIGAETRHEIHVEIQLPDRKLPVINLGHLNHLRCKLVITELMLANAYNLSKCGVFPHAYTYV